MYLNRMDGESWGSTRGSLHRQDKNSEGLMETLQTLSAGIFLCNIYNKNQDLPVRP